MSPLVIAFSVLISIGVGIALGIWKAGLTARGWTLCALYLASIVLQACGAPSGESWGKAFGRLLVLGAIPALVCHVLPAMMAYALTTFVRKRRRSSSRF